MGTGNVIRIPGWSCGKYALHCDLIDGLAELVIKQCNESAGLGALDLVT